MEEPQKVMENIDELKKRLEESAEDRKKKSWDALQARLRYKKERAKKYILLKFNPEAFGNSFPKLKTKDDYDYYMDADDELYDLYIDAETKKELAQAAKENYDEIKTLLEATRSQLSYLKSDIPT